MMKFKHLFYLLFSCCLNTTAQNFDIYVSDAGNFNNPPWKIIKYDSSGANPTTFINSNLAWPQDILFLEDSNTVLISNLNNGRISRYNATNGAFINHFAVGLAGPTRMKIGADTLLYVLQWNGAGIVRRYRLDGTFLGNFTSVGVAQSIGMDWDAQGNLYVSSFQNGHVRKFGPNGADSGLFVTTNLAGPTNIWFDNNGDLLVSDYSGNAIKRFNSNGVFQSIFISGVGQTEGIDFLPNGNILVGNGANSSVKEYTPTGIYLGDKISSGLGSILTPNAVRIRMHNTVSILENKKTEQLIILPTIGSQFNIQAASRRILSIKIFDITGKLIKSLNPNQQLIWNAEQEIEGVYFIVVYLENEGLFTQKVMVKK